MSIQQSQGEIDERLSAKDVDDYLRRNPEFFEKHTQLLTELRVPHLTNGAVSLVERQVDLLRTQNKKLKKQLDDLLQIARANDKLGKQVYKLTLGLMSVDNLEDLLNLLQISMRRDFSADALALRIVGQPLDTAMGFRREFANNTDEIVSNGFDKALQDGRPLCGRMKTQQRTFLFGDKAEQVSSLALLPLMGEGSFGLLAIGSFEEKRFHSGMGTVYLSQMASLISKSLLKFIQPTYI